MAGTSVATRPSGETRFMQGIAVPAEAVNPPLFFELTRRHQTPETSRSYGGGGVTHNVELRKADILSSITLRFVGQVVVTGGTTNSTAAWPLGIAGVRFTANGQSNLINTGQASASGGGLEHIRARDYMKKSDLTDRGVTATLGGVARTQGTLKLASEDWGPATNTTGIAAGTYTVDLTFSIPVSEDEADLVGAIFLQTSSSDLTLAIDETPVGQLFSGGTATSVAITGQWQVSTTKFSIPVVNNSIVVPNLNVFHSIIATRQSNGVGNGENEHRIIGQGAGKSLLRIFGRIINGTGVAAAPLAMTTANFGPLAYRFGNNETPDTFLDGSSMRADMERRYNTDLGGLRGYFCHDFAHENAFRDVLDMGTAAELRLVTSVQNSVSLSGAALEYVTETVFLSGNAA
jgi:hypothetical protein